MPTKSLETTTKYAEARDNLRANLKITPKTADTLIKAGYINYKQLADVSPNQVAKQFGDILELPSSHVTSYRRAFRRIVWAAAQEDPKKHAQECKDWSNKALQARGLWCSDFDELTGRQIDAKSKILPNILAHDRALPRRKRGQ